MRSRITCCIPITSIVKKRNFEEKAPAGSGGGFGFLHERMRKPLQHTYLLRFYFTSILMAAKRGTLARNKGVEILFKVFRDPQDPFFKKGLERGFGGRAPGVKKAGCGAEIAKKSSGAGLRPAKKKGLRGKAPQVKRLGP